ncbi:unnamed protein product, partial [Pylaiella littoralis]
MCHARTTKGSQLSLSQVDEILSPFFKTMSNGGGDPAGADRRVAAALETAAAAGTTDEYSSTQPPHRPDDRVHHRQGVPNPCGGPGVSVGGGGARGVSVDESEDERDPCCTAGGEAAAAGVPLATDSNDSRCHQRPPRRNPRRTKKIRFTGELGAFLDGGGVWNDFAVMEAERKAELHKLPEQRQQSQRTVDEQRDGVQKKSARAREGEEEEE